jgi:hypothetical protein
MTKKELENLTKVSDALFDCCDLIVADIKELEIAARKHNRLKNTQMKVRCLDRAYGMKTALGRVYGAMHDSRIYVVSMLVDKELKAEYEQPSKGTTL